MRKELQVDLTHTTRGKLMDKINPTEETAAVRYERGEKIRNCNCRTNESIYPIKVRITSRIRTSDHEILSSSVIPLDRKIIGDTAVEVKPINLEKMPSNWWIAGAESDTVFKSIIGVNGIPHEISGYDVVRCAFVAFIECPSCGTCIPKNYSLKDLDAESIVRLDAKLRFKMYDKENMYSGALFTPPSTTVVLLEPLESKEIHRLIMVAPPESKCSQPVSEASASK